MKPIITLHNLPHTFPESMLEVMLFYHNIHYKQVAFEPEEQPRNGKTAYVLLQSPKNVKFALRSLNDCEVADCFLKAERANNQAEDLFSAPSKSREVNLIESKSIQSTPIESKPKEAIGIPVKDHISIDDLTPEQCLFEAMDLHKILQRNLKEQRFEKAMPIQALAIPPALEGRDVIGKAQTGTGKTLAFALPMINRFIETGGGQGMKGLILTPTRELAVQIHEVITGLLKDTGLATVVVYGGDSIHEQMLLLKQGMDIIVATPGRLLDMQERRRIRIDSAEMLVLDEADRMLDMGFQPQLQKILKAFYVHPQTLMFSATISPPLKKLMTSMLDEPVYVEAGNPNMVPLDAISQESYYVHSDDKNERLYDILDQETGPIIVFANMKRSVEKLYQQLKREGYPAVRIHGDIPQADRSRAVNAFKRGDYQILVATDVAARGLDIEGVAHVVNFDLSDTPEDHLHRIGRTARAGASGKATTFLQPSKKKSHKSFHGVLGRGN